MALTTSQKKVLLNAYYSSFNQDIRDKILSGTQSNDRLAACLVHLKGECEVNRHTRLTMFDLFSSETVLFGFSLRNIIIPDMSRATSKLKELGENAAIKYEGYDFFDYLADVKSFYKKTTAEGELKLSKIADYFADRNLKQQPQNEFDQDTFWNDDFGEGTVTDAANDLFDFSEELLESPTKQINRLSYLNIAELVKSGDSEVQELLNNLCWMYQAKQQMDEDSSDKNVAFIDIDLFMAAASGCIGLISDLAVAFKKQPFLVEFPKESTKLRERLLDVVDERTTETVTNSVRGASKHWFAIAENKHKAKLGLDWEVDDLLRNLLTKSNDGTISFCVGDIEQLLCSCAELRARFSLPENKGLLIRFIENNLLQNSTPVLQQAKAAKQTLYKRVIGQTQAVESVSSALSSLMVSGGNQHLGVSTFLGESGSGKTHLAECFANVFTEELSLDYQFLVMNMEQYSDKRDVSKLFGSGSQYVDSALGDITLPVVKKPRTIIVFDEIEKAHKEVIQSLLTLIDKGVAEDRTTGRKVDFSLCYFVFTTNIGSDDISKFSSQNEMDVIELLTRKKSNSDRVLSPEMANRLAAGNVTIFRPLTAGSLIKLAKAEAAKVRTESNVRWPESAEEIILATLGGAATPRAIKGQLQKLKGEFISEQLDKLDSNRVSLLNNIRFSSNRIIEAVPVLVSFITKNERLQSYQSKECEICNDTSLYSVRKQLESDSDVVVIDESTLDAEVSDVVKLLNKYREKTILTLGAEGVTPLLSKPCAGALVFEHYIASGRSVNGTTQTIVMRAQHIARLLKYVQTALKRNEKVDYAFRSKVTEEGIEATINLLDRKQVVRAEDADLPFISFAGKPKGALSEVIGQENTKKRLKLIVEMLNGSSRRGSSNIPIPKGYLFAGPPGTGKTHMARSLAAESDMFFFNVNASDLLIGNAVDNVNKLFDVAVRYAPSMIFIDEIDSIAMSRKNATQGATVVVNSLLTALDGFQQKDGKVFVMAATNNPQQLDPALTRAGRFDRTIFFDAPCKKAREKCIRAWFESNHYRLDDTLLNELVTMLEGATIGRIREVFNNSVLTSMSEDIEWQPSVLIEEIRSVKLGAVSHTMVQSKQQIQNTAYHESGHLVAHKLLLPDVPVEFASVQPRGAALGMVVPGASDNEPVLSKQRVKAYLQIFLAGIAAEHMLGLTGDSQTIGGADDRRKATQLAKNAILNWGMSDNFGFAIPSELSVDESTVNNEVNNWLQDAFETVSALLSENKSLLDAISAELAEKEQLDKHDIERLFGSKPSPHIAL
ncbi:hypothetical protein CWC33_06030 [Idiomarina sp. X4]|uniref:AAA family ATPase n=1 Tax=Idiomarina sp. X4 TaxID=2055892 RepID=UPI000C294758|nr:AAA family ATPase [Idiomarina sp. X4]ATZ73281.1 hypothetical protein CWC33_06030 [Idiomarina sp. X4]